MDLTDIMCAPELTGDLRATSVLGDLTAKRVPSIIAQALGMNGKSPHTTQVLAKER